MSPNVHMHARSAAALAVVLMLSACGTARINNDGAAVRDQSNSSVQRNLRIVPLDTSEVTPGGAAFADARAAAAQSAQVSRRASKAWIGARLTNVQSDEVLPPVFSENFNLNFDDRASGGRVSIAVIAERLSRLTRVPVRVKQDVYSAPRNSSGSSNAARPATVAAGTAPQAGAPLPAGFPLPPTGATAGAGAVTATPLPTGLPGSPLAAAGASGEQSFSQPLTDLSSVEMKWSGSLAAFLDNVTARLNLSWSYREGAVVIERYVTENFELAAFVDQQDYRMSLGGSSSGSTGSQGSGGGANSSSTSNVNVNESGKVAALESLRKSIDAMVVPAGGAVVLSEGTGRLTVTATRDIMSRVREVIRHEDAAMQRQAQIQIDIYSVTTNDNDEKGVDWNLIIQNAAKTWGATVSSPGSLTSSLAGGLGYSILSPAAGTAGTRTQARFAGSSVMLNLLTQITDNATYRPISLIALNRQWARQTNLQSTGYLSETTPATSTLTGSGVPGLKTSTVVTGDKFLVQPAILDNGTILLKFGVSLTELLGLFNVSSGSGSSQQTVQTPDTAGTDAQANVRLRPGEAMIVTGLSRRVSTADTRTLADGVPIVAGGSRKLGYKREDFLIVVRAVQI